MPVNLKPVQIMPAYLMASLPNTRARVRPEPLFAIYTCKPQLRVKSPAGLGEGCQEPHRVR